jgi:hypothetical protein
MLLGKLRQEYILSHDGLNAALLAGIEQPPVDWVNGRLGELGEIWAVSEARAGLRSPAGAAITLHELFLKDFKESFGTNFAPRRMADEKEETKASIEGRLLLDVNSASKFVSFYVPRSEYAYQACVFLADNYQEMGGLNLFHVQMQGPAGPVFTESFKFSGRVFIYHEDFFSPEQSGDLHRLYREKNLLLELREQGYLQFEILRRKTAQ